MKDLPHHIKKLNRKVIRSMHREEALEEFPEILTWTQTKKEKRKKQKTGIKKEKQMKPVQKKTPEERNKIMKKGRVPVFDRINNAEPKHSPVSKKKTPPI